MPIFPDTARVLLSEAKSNRRVFLNIMYVSPTLLLAAQDLRGPFKLHFYNSVTFYKSLVAPYRGSGVKITYAE